MRAVAILRINCFEYNLNNCVNAIFVCIVVTKEIDCLNDLRMLHLIRKLYNQDQVEDKQVSEFLCHQDCYHLLLGMPSEKSKVISNIIANQLHVANQYKECQRLLSELNEIP